ncbi:hypothetical protein EI555_001311 [Monodon monoceros]|uniref:EGF-like domain-containing protein n=1 Tax=Monodon monoceros TaxID=40151 RepID=A0A4U1F1R7_MONMO|nr:hypothetical protein EI555_001311 [Monodon monoceros]
MILILAFSRAFELGLVTGLGHCELARPSQGDLAFRDDGLQSREEPAIRHRPSQFVPSMGIQNSKELNRTCCLNGGTCMLGSFCACPPSFYGRNCEHDMRKENCGSVPHDTWLPRKCSMCKCWHGQFRCFPQPFLPGCGKQRVASFALSAHCTHQILGPNCFWVRVDVPRVCQQDKVPEGFPLMTKCLYLPDGHVMDEHLTASGTPELALSACAFMLPGICLAIQSYY